MLCQRPVKIREEEPEPVYPQSPFLRREAFLLIQLLCSGIGCPAPETHSSEGPRGVWGPKAAEQRASICLLGSRTQQGMNFYTVIHA